MKLPLVLTLCLVLSVAGGTVRAHHSFAMFDTTKPVSLEATVKELQWTNPHAWLPVTAPDAKGKIVEWSVELGSPNMLSRSGLKTTSFTSGEKLQIVIYPARDGSIGGALWKVKQADGTRMEFSLGAHTVIQHDRTAYRPNGIVILSLPGQSSASQRPDQIASRAIRAQFDNVDLNVVLHPALMRLLNGGTNVVN